MSARVAASRTPLVWSSVLVTCVSCGFAARPDFAFCPRCGARLEERAAPAPAQEADRRTATVLFADLSGFTALSERLDPEDVRALQNDLIQELSAAIRKYDGFTEKYIGDAVLAVFGAPVAHEDDAERALHAALAMKERVRLLSVRWQRWLGAPLELHIGVNTGPVVAGHVGTGASAAYAVTGDTVNTAARLQGEAGPGEVLVSEPTFRLTQHAFAFGDEVVVRLKGKSEPVTVYRLLALHSTPRAARGLDHYGLSTPLIGRQSELETLQCAFDGMLAGRTQVVSVVGEAGAGKSRLVSEFLAAQERRGSLAGTVVRRVVCYSTGEQTYGVIAALLREAYDLSPDDTLDTALSKLAQGFEALGAGAAETAHLAGVLGHALGLAADDTLVEHLEPDQLKRQLYTAAGAVLERRLEHSPLLLIVEDLHWADVASLELLSHLIERLGDRRLMILTTFRATPFQGLRTAQAERTLIRISPLRAQECEQLLAACFAAAQQPPLPDALRDVVIERSGGNPLFLEEILRTLIAQATPAQRDGGPDAASSTVPLTLHGLLLAHIDRLPARARTVLQQAAVIGPVFDEALLTALNDRSAVDDSLAVLVAAELVVRSGTEDESAARAWRTYRFRHGLLQEAVYQNLLVRRRTELHTRVAEALELLYGEQPKRLEDIEALGHHWSLGEHRQRGARYLMAAGDWARALYANEDALRYYGRALDTLLQCEPGDAALPSVHERLGDVLAIVGRGAEAEEHHRAAVGCYERAGDRPAHARQLRKIAELRWAVGDRGAAKSHLQDALALLDGGGDPIERAHLYQTMGRHAFRSGDGSAAVAWSRRALSEGESALAHATEEEPRRAAAEAVSHAHNTMGVALAQMRRLREAVAQLERSVAIALQHELPRTACRGMANLGVLYSTLDPRRAIETCRRGLETAKRIGDFAMQSRLYSNLALAYCSLTNRCDEHGIGAAQTAIELDRRLGQLDHLTVPLIVLAQIQQCHGSPVAALRHYREALALAEQTGEAQLIYPCYDGLATLYLEAGDEARAEQYMMQAQLVCERAGVQPETLVVLPFLD